MVSSVHAHFGEEPPISGKNGSGTIFFAHCSLRCVFCQNHPISQLGQGKEVSAEELAGMTLKLDGQGCHNINFVTPTHYMPQILEAVFIAREKGLKLPLVYNCGGYEALRVIKLLEGVIDIYMPDFKYFDPEMALRYSAAKDYPETAMAAIKEMHRQVGDLVIESASGGGIAKKGLLVRHLVLPEGIAGTEGVVKFIAEEISRNTHINIMDQYHPRFRAFEMPPLNRRITEREYKDALKMALDAGLKRLDGVTV